MIAMSEDPIRDLRQRLQDLQRDLRDALVELEDPQCKALLETSAEVLGGLVTAFEHYGDKSEPAWLRISRRIFP